uniref:AlNc14C1855G13086 protein n=1 Tax=Albugo laibachii Nc14 TaxID=890382 RepID=F0X2U8_9STRA|nr:AlNc14C1855G13086 [Albugo laibachii Nc14]|eukprot:CCA28262.1 AlNc14C1855G13086 [Albugo laibachii Nc14]
MDLKDTRHAWIQHLMSLNAVSEASCGGSDYLLLNTRHAYCALLQAEQDAHLPKVQSQTQYVKASEGKLSVQIKTAEYEGTKRYVYVDKWDI